MTPLKAVEIVEGLQDSTEDEQLEAWQYLIDTGLCWQLQGCYGRTAVDLIKAGICIPA